VSSFVLLSSWSCEILELYEQAHVSSHLYDEIEHKNPEKAIDVPHAAMASQPIIYACIIAFKALLILMME
jgi:hypothetical protein